MGNRLVVVAWHNVEGTWCYPSRPGTGARGLAHQLASLARLATIVPLQPALDALKAGEPLPPRSVALTFDDGYQDSLDIAAPILEELDLPATFFLVPGLLSRDVRPWWEVLAWGFARARAPAVRWDGRTLRTGGQAGRHSYRWAAERVKAVDRVTRESWIDELLSLLEPEGRADDERLFLDWEGARALARRGFAVGSHSMYHALLSRETSEEQLRDLANSRQQLECELGVPVGLLAYPNGTRLDYNGSTLHAAAQAGHTHALGAHAGLNLPSTPPYERPRFVLEPDRGFSETLLRRIFSRIAHVL
jgi:peptidoglycan/xylan/chitin deacetylase (PgdA/CDA1 family)